ncbi:MAG TPA: EF-hand domain-containing protein [Streptosporangiaceae bacterium]|nr:EF-hand domain-containing protein [Streptosporangiaceae bacterium]
MTEYKATFELIDSDDDGLISAAELVRLFTALGEEVTQEQAQQIVRAADASADDRISLQEFATYMATRTG